jgi:hypothetical protein
MLWHRPQTGRVERCTDEQGNAMTSAVPRLARRLGWDRNPLRRQADRMEAVVVTGLLAAFLIAAPWLGILGGRLADDAVRQQQRIERTWRQVPATLLQNAAVQAAPSARAGSAWVTARWTAPGGQRRAGEVAVRAPARAGQRRLIWVDPAGQLTGPPSGRTDVAVVVALGVLAATAGLACPFVLAGGCVRLILNRRRLADWESGWRAVGPRWSRLP